MSDVVAPQGVEDEELDAYLVKASRTADPNQQSALAAFQSEIGRFPLLARDQQNELAARCHAGAVAVQALQDHERGISKLGKRQHAKAVEAAQEGAQAAEYLVGSCLRLVIVIAREQGIARFGRARAIRTLPELVAEGNVALSQAVRDYDPTTGIEFSKYAAMRIRNGVRQALDKQNPIKVRSAWEKVQRIVSELEPELTQKLGRRPTMEELRQALTEHAVAWAIRRLPDLKREIPLEQQRELAIVRLRKQGILRAIKELEQVINAPTSVASLDQTFAGDSDGTLSDMLAASGTDPEKKAVRDELRRDISTALDELSERERAIVVLRYGLDGKTPRRFPEIQEELQLDLSAERIRQIEKQALSRMRDPRSHMSFLARHIPDLAEDD